MIARLWSLLTSPASPPPYGEWLADETTPDASASAGAASSSLLGGGEEEALSLADEGAVEALADALRRAELTPPAPPVLEVPEVPPPHCGGLHGDPVAVCDYCDAVAELARRVRALERLAGGRCADCGW